MSGPREPAAPTAAELDVAASLHQQLFTGLILGLAGHHGQHVAADFVYRTFRRQHDERFLRGLERLGLRGLPPAHACAQFICLSNRAGGLDVQYRADGERRAWVRYPPPRWAYEGPAICALDDRVTVAFLRGFHARCGPSLGNPRLRFVCTAMTTHGDPGLAGYFEEADAPLPDDGRLVLRPGSGVPAFDDDAAPALPWAPGRAAVARRNYAVRYIEVMLPVVAELLGHEPGAAFAARIARLIGLQGYRDSARRLGIAPGSRPRALAWLAAVQRGTGHAVAALDEHAGRIVIERSRVAAPGPLLRAWSGLLEGAVAAHDASLVLEPDGALGWRLHSRPPAGCEAATAEC